MASVDEVRALLVNTTMPEPVIDQLLERASALWLMGAPATLLAADLVLCHPAIGPTEVRAVAHRIDDRTMRLTVAAHDRRGLLADTAGVLAAENLSILGASAMSWTESKVALHSLTVSAADLSTEAWAELGIRLRSLGGGDRPSVKFTPTGRAVVSSSPSAMGRCVLTVTAPDQIGLLWAICQWLADEGSSIEAAHIGTDAGTVRDHFVVVGAPDPVALEARLTGPHLARQTPRAGMGPSADDLAAGTHRLAASTRSLAVGTLSLGVGALKLAAEAGKLAADAGKLAAKTGRLAIRRGRSG